MIQANELRIGNCIQTVNDHTPFVIKELHMMHFIMRPWDNILFEPIPLTPELLEKIGFRHGKYETTDSVVYFKVYSDGDVKVVVEPDSDPYYRTDIGQPIRYLHQLQNLYFTLTGEELEVSL